MRDLYSRRRAPADEGSRLRGEGWITVAGLAHTADALADAARMRCSHALIDGTVREAARDKVD